MILKRVSKKVTHQDIGGKIINIDEGVTEHLTKFEVMEKAEEGNPACFNFVMRRPDFNVLSWGYKLYYGHVDGLGYIVSEDELEEV